MMTSNDDSYRVGGSPCIYCERKKLFYYKYCISIKFVLIVLVKRNKIFVCIITIMNSLVILLSIAFAAIMNATIVAAIANVLETESSEKMNNLIGRTKRTSSHAKTSNHHVGKNATTTQTTNYVDKLNILRADLIEHNIAMGKFITKSDLLAKAILNADIANKFSEELRKFSLIYKITLFLYSLQTQPN